MKYRIFHKSSVTGLCNHVATIVSDQLPQKIGTKTHMALEEHLKDLRDSTGGGIYVVLPVGKGADATTIYCPVVYNVTESLRWTIE